MEKLDIAVNNAGIGGDFKITHEYSIDNWDKVIAINQTGVFYCMQAELAQMVQQGTGGAIVWFCTEETGFITGHSMPVDGAMTA